MKYIVGLTGGIASGKSLVAAHFEKKGINIADADQCARDVVMPGSAALATIADHFGAEVLQNDGTLNRKRVRDIIFSYPQQKAWLEQLLHPLIRERLLWKTEQFSSPYGILVSPLLLETDQHLLVDRILVVDIPEALQIQRCMQRDGSSMTQIKSIIRSQISRDHRLERANDILDNTSSVPELYKQIDILHQHYLALSQNVTT